MKKIIYGVTDRGIRVGEHHQHAKLSNEQVDYIRGLYEEGLFGYRSLVRVCKDLWGIEVSRDTVKDIVKYRRRSATPERYKTVVIDENNAVRVGKDLSRGHDLV